MENAIQTTHNLDFEVAQWINPLRGLKLQELGVRDDDKWSKIEWSLYRVGTCEGQFRVTPEAYEILSVINSNPGNGHFDDLLQWFEFACKRSRLPLRILKFTNLRFRLHLIKKRGFRLLENKDDVEKNFLTK